MNFTLNTMNNNNIKILHSNLLVFGHRGNENSINHWYYGWDGSYLAELLLEKGYDVHGIGRSSMINTRRIDHIYDNPNLHLHYGDLTDSGNIMSLIMKSTQ